MLVFGGVAVVLCVPGNLLLWHLRGGQDSLLWMLALSFSSLFLYAALSLSVSYTHLDVYKRQGILLQ